jgi:hypothetical protein
LFSDVLHNLIILGRELHSLLYFSFFTIQFRFSVMSIRSVNFLCLSAGLCYFCYVISLQAASERKKKTTFRALNAVYFSSSLTFYRLSH